MGKENFDENLKRLEREIAKRRESQCNERDAYYNFGCTSLNNCGMSVCQQPEYREAYNAMGQSCAKVSAAYQPNYQRHDDWDKARIDVLQKECQNLADQKNKAWLANMKLQEEVNRLKQELYELKNKKAKKKFDFDIAIYDTFNKIGIGVKALYQDVINWFNT
jgi:hypothetical protein